MARIKPSLAGIAAELGVSTASVSNALHRPELVSADLRARVLEVATRSGYTGPAAAARLLPGGRPNSLGVLFTAELPDALRDPAAVAFLQGFSVPCENAGIGVTLIPEVVSQPGARQIMIANAMVDGFVVYSLRDRDPLLGTVLDRGLPTVVVDAPRDSRGADWVGCDDRGASRALGTYLVTLGHRRVGIIAPQLAANRLVGRAEPTRWAGSEHALMTERIDGLLSGLDLDPAEVDVQERYVMSVESGADAMNALLDENPEVTAVCCLTDVLAIGALHAARRRGLSVPDQLTVTGFDDVPEAATLGLTTVAQPQIEKGRVTADLLLSADRVGASRRRLLPTHVQIRASSGPPRRV